MIFSHLAHWRSTLRRFRWGDGWRTHIWWEARDEWESLEFAEKKFFALHHVDVLVKGLSIGELSTAVTDENSRLRAFGTKFDVLLKRLDIILKRVAVHASKSI